MRTTTVDDPSAAHACAVPGSDEQLWEMTAAFVAAGLAAGEQVVYFDDGTADAVLERLVDDRVPVRRPLADGQFTVVGSEETRKAVRSSVPEAAAMLSRNIDEAVAAGYAGFRTTGQLSSALTRTDGIGLADYDPMIDRVIAGRPARVLCFYDRVRFPDPAAVRPVRRLPSCPIPSRIPRSSRQPGCAGSTSNRRAARIATGSSSRRRRSTTTPSSASPGSRRSAPASPARSTTATVRSSLAS